MFYFRPGSFKGMETLVIDCRFHAFNQSIALCFILSTTSTSCQSCLQTTTWIIVRRRWMKWMQPCQIWRLPWREGRLPTHWYETKPLVLECALGLPASFLSKWASLCEFVFPNCEILASVRCFCFYLWRSLLSSALINMTGNAQRQCNALQFAGSAKFHSYSKALHLTKSWGF